MLNEAMLQEELNKLANKTALMVFTDKVACEKWNGVPDEFKMDRLLEIRVFDESAEFRAVRDCMGAEFYARTLEADSENEIQEIQYLDIDDTKSSGHKYVTTGGGEYELPVADAKTITICNVIECDEDGVYRVVDFRIVKVGE